MHWSSHIFLCNQLTDSSKVVSLRLTPPPPPPHEDSWSRFVTDCVESRAIMHLEGLIQVQTFWLECLNYDTTCPSLNITHSQFMKVNTHTGIRMKLWKCRALQTIQIQQQQTLSIHGYLFHHTNNLICHYTIYLLLRVFLFCTSYISQWYLLELVCMDMTSFIPNIALDKFISHLTIFSKRQ
jgi:hypothetical protein